MKYITDTLDFSLERRSAVTLGKFDGLHRGHQKLVNRIREFGKDGFETVIFTFDVTPLALLGKGAKEMLLTPQERARLARDLGVDCMIACPFREEIRNMEAEVFVRDTGRAAESGPSCGRGGFSFRTQKKGNAGTFAGAGTPLWI